jgi:hypothetical protein
MSLVMMVVVMVARRIRGLPRGVTRPQRGMYLLTTTSLDEVDRMGDNTIGQEYLHVLLHGLDTPGECHDEGVFDRSCDWSRQRRERCVFDRRREYEMCDPRRMSLDQR